MTNEIEYRDIPNYPGYQISRDGQIRGRWLKGCVAGLGTTWRFLKPSVGLRGYKFVRLTIAPCKSVAKYIHHLLLETFVGQRPKGMQCRHLNGNRLDNRLENLRWGSQSENVIDMIRHGTHYTPFRHPSKYSQDLRKEIRQRYELGESTRTIGKDLKISNGVIWQIVARKGAYRD